jgi:hypothetical protein
MEFVALGIPPGQFWTCNISMMQQIEVIIWDVHKVFQISSKAEGKEY